MQCLEVSGAAVRHQRVKYVLYRHFTENSILVKLFTSLWPSPLKQHSLQLQESSVTCLLKRVDSLQVSVQKQSPNSRMDCWQVSDPGNYKTDALMLMFSSSQSALQSHCWGIQAGFPIDVTQHKALLWKAVIQDDISKTSIW